MANELLAIEDLQVNIMTARGIIHAVRGVDLKVRENEIHGIVGESGCGKSVTIKSVMRLHDEEKTEYVGKIKFDGKDIFAFNKRQLRDYRGKDVSMIFQDPMTSLDMIMRSGEQIAEMLRKKQKISKEEAKKKVCDIFEKVGITPAEQRYKQYPFEMSGGLIQRVMIAMAIASDPKLLIADEPTTALDVTIQAQILQLIKQVQQDTKMSVILVTHNLGVVAEICDKVSVMYAGKVVETGNVVDIFDHPKHPYTRDLLNCMPSKAAGKNYLPYIEGHPPLLYDPPKGCAYADRCRFATDKCFEECPSMDNCGAEHVTACFHWKEMEG
ncbi:MAG: ABC transporter ATP-binding protein [Wujia sp.]